MNDATEKSKVAKEGDVAWERAPEPALSATPSRLERMEKRLKIRFYEDMRDRAMETFRRVSGRKVESREDAVEALRAEFRNGTYRGAAELVFAAAEYTVACSKLKCKAMVAEEVADALAE